MKTIPQTQSNAARISIREVVADKIVEIMKPVYFFLRRRKQPWKTTMAELRAMEQGTLGKDLFVFLESHNLQLMPKAEFHDVYHVLFELETNMHDETVVQFIPMGNGKRSLPYLASTLVAIIFYPEYWEDFYRAYMKGNNAPTFHNWNFEQLLHLKTADIRKRMFGVGG